MTDDTARVLAAYVTVVCRAQNAHQTVVRVELKRAADNAAIKGAILYLAEINAVRYIYQAAVSTRPGKSVGHYSADDAAYRRPAADSAFQSACVEASLKIRSRDAVAATEYSADVISRGYSLLAVVSDSTQIGAIYESDARERRVSSVRDAADTRSTRMVASR